MPFRIEALSDQNLSDINRANQPFEILGKVTPSLQNGRWSLKESLLPEGERYLKTYPCDEVDYTAYIGSGDRAAFLCYDGEECIGQTVLHRDWNRYAFVEDLCVAAQHRRKGVGKALMEQACIWAKAQGMKGLSLETQDNNVAACRFYSAIGMELGGVNTKLYRQFDRPYSEETALFWYLEFDRQPKIRTRATVGGQTAPDGSPLRVGAIVWGVKNVRRAVDFWSRALNYRLKYPASDDWAILIPKDGEGIQLSISLVSSEKAKRHHIDLFTEDQEKEVNRLLKLEATRAEWNYPPGADYVVLHDPDGNPFCVVDRKES